MQSILENILALYAVEWLEKRCAETSSLTGVAQEMANFDGRHKVYRDLQGRLIAAYPEVLEIRDKLGE